VDVRPAVQATTGHRHADDREVARQLGKERRQIYRWIEQRAIVLLRKPTP
jgi:hypothetical protein